MHFIYKEQHIIYAIHDFMGDSNMPPLVFHRPFALPMQSVIRKPTLIYLQNIPLNPNTSNLPHCSEPRSHYCHPSPHNSAACFHLLLLLPHGNCLPHMHYLLSGRNHIKSNIMQIISLLPSEASNAFSINRIYSKPLTMDTRLTWLFRPQFLSHSPYCSMLKVQGLSFFLQLFCVLSYSRIFALIETTRSFSPFTPFGSHINILFQRIPK